MEKDEEILTVAEERAARRELRRERLKIAKKRYEEKIELTDNKRREQRYAKRIEELSEAIAGDTGDEA